MNEASSDRHKGSPGTAPHDLLDGDERAELHALLSEAREQVARIERALAALDEAQLHPIVVWRRRRGMSQAELARTIGISAPALCRIENSRGLAAREETRRKLAEALGVQEQDLVNNGD